MLSFAQGMSTNGEWLDCPDSSILESEVVELKYDSDKYIYFIHQNDSHTLYRNLINE